MSDTEELQPHQSPRKPVQPLPRLWKTEPDSEELEGLPPVKDASSKKSAKGKDDAPSGPAVQPRSKGKSKSGKEKSTPAGDEKTEKKVLKEDTPTLDTYESRRRARMLVGGLTVVCVLLFGWIVYTGFIYDPSPVMGSEDPLTAASVPEPKPSFDREAQFMFDRARGFDKNGKTDQAIGMLNTLIKVKNYKDTPTALAAKAALDRYSQNCPCLAMAPSSSPQPSSPSRHQSPPHPRPLLRSSRIRPIQRGVRRPSSSPPTPQKLSCCRRHQPRPEPRLAEPPAAHGPSPRVSRPIFRPVSTSRAGRL